MIAAKCLSMWRIKSIRLFNNSKAGDFSAKIGIKMIVGTTLSLSARAGANNKAPAFTRDKR